MLQPGTVFAVRYRIERRIADGGMGAVYEVTHLATERRCALKVMLAGIASDPGLRERFLNEARIAAKVQSDHIVDVFDAGLDEDSGALFLVMELLVGEDLDQRLQREQALPAAEVLPYFRQLASALSKTHAQGIVHRDLKPQNLFLTRSENGAPRIKILDFGISKVLQETTAGDKRTEVLGSPLYMAPEQFSGQLPTPATDIFAVGMVAYSLLVGIPYWREEAVQFDNPLAFGMHVAQGPRESAVARALAAGMRLPEAFDAWFFKMTDRLPEKRFASAVQAVEALSVALADEPKRLAKRSPLEKTERVDTIGPTASDDSKRLTHPKVNARTARAWISAHGFRLGAASAAVLGAVGLWQVSTRSSVGNRVDPQGLPTADIATSAAPTWPLQTTSEVPALPTNDGSRDVSTAARGGMNDPEAVARTSPKPAVDPAFALGPRPTAGPERTSSGLTATPAPAPRATSAPPPRPAVPLPSPTRTCYSHLSSGAVKLYTPGTNTRGQPIYPCVRGTDGTYRRKTQ